MIRQNLKFDQKASGLGGGGGVTSGTLIDGPKICIGEGGWQSMHGIERHGMVQHGMAWHSKA